MNVFITGNPHDDTADILRGVIATAYYQRHTVIVSTACPIVDAIRDRCQAWRVPFKTRASSFQGNAFTDADTNAVLSADSVLLLYLGDATQIRLERIRAFAAKADKPVLYRRALRIVQLAEDVQIIRLGV